MYSYQDCSQRFKLSNEACLAPTKLLLWLHPKTTRKIQVRERGSCVVCVLWGERASFYRWSGGGSLENAPPHLEGTKPTSPHRFPTFLVLVQPMVGLHVLSWTDWPKLGLIGLRSRARDPTRPCAPLLEPNLPKLGGRAPLGLLSWPMWCTRWVGLIWCGFYFKPLSSGL
jgi:hypothetical protein